MSRWRAPRPSKPESELSKMLVIFNLFSEQVRNIDLSRKMGNGDSSAIGAAPGSSLASAGMPEPLRGIGTAGPPGGSSIIIKEWSWLEGLIQAQIKSDVSDL